MRHGRRAGSTRCGQTANAAACARVRGRARGTGDDGWCGSGQAGEDRLAVQAGARSPTRARTQLTTTVVQTNGDSERRRSHRSTSKPPIDCFYVYPTVSEQASENANLEIEPQETQIAIEQASRFSQDCKVYAPMYPQLTLAAINSGDPITPAWPTSPPTSGVRRSVRTNT